MKKIFVCLAAFLSCSASLFAQNAGTSNGEGAEPQNSFYAELGGPGILFSANIDRRFTPSRYGWGGRVGLGFVTLYEDGNTPNGNYYGRQVSVPTFPLGINYIFGKGSSPHTFEVGGGVTFAGKKIDIFNYYNKTATSVFGTASFMYRRQPVGGGFTWRAGFTPIIGSGYIQPSGGVGVGFNF